MLKYAIIAIIFFNGSALSATLYDQLLTTLADADGAMSSQDDVGTTTELYRIVADDFTVSTSGSGSMFIDGVDVWLGSYDEEIPQGFEGIHLLFYMDDGSGFPLTEGHEPSASYDAVPADWTMTSLGEENDVPDSSNLRYHYLYEITIPAGSEIWLPVVEAEATYFFGAQPIYNRETQTPAVKTAVSRQNTCEDDSLLIDGPSLLHFPDAFGDTDWHEAIEVGGFAHNFDMIFKLYGDYDVGIKSKSLGNIKASFK